MSCDVLSQNLTAGRLAQTVYELLLYYIWLKFEPFTSLTSTSAVPSHKTSLLSEVSHFKLMVVSAVDEWEHAICVL